MDIERLVSLKGMLKVEISPYTKSSVITAIIYQLIGRSLEALFMGYSAGDRMCSVTYYGWDLNGFKGMLQS